MNKSYKIYLDACCLNRPFDDQQQARIYIETQAVVTILVAVPTSNLETH